MTDKKPPCVGCISLRYDVSNLGYVAIGATVPNVLGSLCENHAAELPVQSREAMKNLAHFARDVEKWPDIYGPRRTKAGVKR
jgi:hypothetical protein